MKLIYGIYYYDICAIGDDLYSSYEEVLDNTPNDGRYYIVVFQYHSEEGIK